MHLHIQMRKTIHSAFTERMVFLPVEALPPAFGTHAGLTERLSPLLGTRTHVAVLHLGDILGQPAILKEYIVGGVRHGGRDAERVGVLSVSISISKSFNSFSISLRARAYNAFWRAD